ncbi:hypothetical protein THIOKS11140043 [Thiocapsa sp. KS1]|nr:hypothetical protein THIOKS11140043 [Thiocapsa sp. KS1]
MAPGPSQFEAPRELYSPRRAAKPTHMLKAGEGSRLTSLRTVRAVLPHTARVMRRHRPFDFEPANPLPGLGGKAIPVARPTIKPGTSRRSSGISSHSASPPRRSSSCRCTVWSSRRSGHITASAAMLSAASPAPTGPTACRSGQTATSHSTGFTASRARTPRGHPDRCRGCAWSYQTLAREIGAERYRRHRSLGLSCGVLLSESATGMIPASAHRS